VASTPSAGSNFFGIWARNGEYLNEPLHPIRCPTDASLLLDRHGVEHDRNGVAVHEVDRDVQDGPNEVESASIKCRLPNPSVS